MNVKEKIQEILCADAGVLAVVPVERIKAGFGGQDLAMPYISHSWIGSQETRTHAGRARLQMWPLYQVSAFDSTESGADALAAAIMNALQDYKSGGIQVMRADYGAHLYEDPEVIHQQILEFSIAESL